MVITMAFLAISVSSKSKSKCMQLWNNQIVHVEKKENIWRIVIIIEKVSLLRLCENLDSFSLGRLWERTALVKAWKSLGDQEISWKILTSAGQEKEKEEKKTLQLWIFLEGLQKKERKPNRSRGLSIRDSFFLDAIASLAPTSSSTLLCSLLLKVY